MPKYRTIPTIVINFMVGPSRNPGRIIWRLIKNFIEGGTLYTCCDLPNDCDHKAGNPCQRARLIVCGCDNISLTELTLDAYWGLTEMLYHSVSWLSNNYSCALLTVP